MPLNAHNTWNNLTMVISVFVFNKILSPVKSTIIGFKIKQDLNQRLKGINMLN